MIVSETFRASWNGLVGAMHERAERWAVCVRNQQTSSETSVDVEACPETRGSFDLSGAAPSPFFFRLRLAGPRWGRAWLIGPTISSKPAGTPNVATVRHEAPEGKGHTEAVWCAGHAPMLAQASIICCPETEVRPASRAWLLASLMMKQMNSVAHSCTSLFASLDILVLYPRLLLASSLAMILAMHAIGNCCGWGRGG